MKYARLDNNIVKEIFEVPVGHTIAECIQPEYVSKFISVPPNVTVGSKLIDGQWSIYEAPVVEVNQNQEQLSLPVELSKLDFYMLFSSQERIAIKTAKSTDAMIEDFLSIIEDPSFTKISTNDANFKDFVSYLLDNTYLTEDRSNIVKSGIKYQA